MTGGRGQSEVVGFVLLVSLTLLVAGAAVTLGSGALTTTQQRAATAGAGNSMAALDSQVSQVALGSTNNGSLALGNAGSGRYEVRPNAGWIKLVKDNGTNTTILNETLGAVVYRNGDTTLAYQDGGVWRAQGGGSVLVSPPEFHYGAQTLTLPVVSVADGGQTGSERATVSRVRTDLPRYPNATRGFSNPLSDGNLTLRVHSRYTRAWARYFRSQTTANVTREGDTVRVDLSTVGTQGRFSLGTQIEARGVASGHAVRTFNLSVAPAQSNFSSTDLTLTVHGNGRTFHVAIGKPSGNKHVSCSEAPKSFPAWIYYSNGTAYQSWKGAYNVTCVDGTPKLQVALTSNRTFTYGSSYRDHTAEPFAGNVTLDQHPADNNRTVVSGTTANSSFLARHYLALVRDEDGSFSAQVSAGNEADVDFSQSSAVLHYDASKWVVTYLHATENRVAVAVP